MSHFDVEFLRKEAGKFEKAPRKTSAADISVYLFTWFTCQCAPALEISAGWPSSSRHRYRCGRSGVRFPGWSNRIQCHWLLATAAMFLRRAVLSRRWAAEMGAVIRFTLRRNFAITIKIWFTEFKRLEWVVFFHAKLEYIRMISTCWLIKCDVSSV